MMPSPRWRKIGRDLFQNKGRTAMTMISIAVGVLAIGFTGMAQNVLDKGMEATYQSSNPSQITFVTSPFQNSLLSTIRGLPGVSDAQSRTTLSAQIDTQSENSQPKPDTWQPMSLTAVPNFSSLSMDKIGQGSGQIPAHDGELALDETSLLYLNMKLGQKVWVQTTDGKVHTMKVTGTVQNTEVISSHFSGTSYGYITPDELPSLGAPQAFNTLNVQVQGDRMDVAHIESVAQTVRNALRDNHVQVESTIIPPPGKHWAYDIVHSMVSVLQLIGYLDAILGACLVFNTVLASLTSQTRQIGVMKSFGGTVGQLVGMYLGYVAVLSLFATAAGVVLAMGGAKVATSFSVVLLGFKSHGFGFSTLTILKMLLVGLVIPMLAGLVPILAGARLSVRDAISGVDSAAQNMTWLDVALERIQGLPRVLVMALRNTFRRKGRLILTIMTLGLGGAVVMGTWTVQKSLDLSFNQSMKYTAYDIQVNFVQPESIEDVTAIARGVASVKGVQCWTDGSGTIVRSDGRESGDIHLLAAPPDSSYIHPTLVQGRWLEPTDTNAIVIDTYLLHEEPNIHVGQNLTLNVNGHPTVFHVVGLLKKVAGDVNMYVMPSTLKSLTDELNTTTVMNVRTSSSDASTVSHIAAQLNTDLTHAGHPVDSIRTTQEIRDTDISKVGVVLSFLQVMSILVTIVAGLGLMGSQTLNVLERTREIGVLRSIGASTGAIWFIVVQEGLFIGFLGWGLALPLSIPIGHLLSNTVGQSMFLANLDFGYQYWAIPAWLLIALVISVLSSLLPARNATRLTVRDVLTHEG